VRMESWEPGPGVGELRVFHQGSIWPGGCKDSYDGWNVVECVDVLDGVGDLPRLPLRAAKAAPPIAQAGVQGRYRSCSTGADLHNATTMGGMRRRSGMMNLPATIVGHSAWYGPDVTGRTEWIEYLSATELAEIEVAGERLQLTQTNWQTLHADDFPLPTLGRRLSQMLKEVLDGRGFVLLRGFPVERWGRQRSAVAFLGLGLHCGSLCSQNAHGHLLGHVKDLGLTSRDPNVRIYQTKERQNFHTDSCDVVGLLCLQRARSGGRSSLVSSVTIYNEMRQRNPELARVLFEPIETDRRGEIPVGREPFFRIPVFSWYAGLLSTVYQRSYIESARRFPEVPPLTPKQIEALDLFDQLANDPALNFQMELQVGDIQLVHNHTLLHDRTAFEDWPEPERKRHLLRLWLAPETARSLPPVFAERYGSVVPGQRGGIVVRGTRLTVPWDSENAPGAS
jgi:hypothetical protein